MGADANHDDPKEPNYEGEALLLHGRITDLEREKAEREKEEKEYRGAQLAVNQGQLKTNQQIAIFTLLLVICTAITGVIAWRQATIARVAAEAAQRSAAAAQTNADVAKKTLVEMQKSGSDTHELAEAAKAQTVELAESLHKSDELIREASAQSRAAQDSVKLATEESARSGERTERQLKILQDQAAASHDQAVAALNSAIAIQRQTIISERPWLSVEVTTEGLTYGGQSGNQPVLILNLSIKNVGKSIAKNIQADARMFAAPPGMPISDKAPQQQKELCDNPKLAQVFSTDLFPSDIPLDRKLDISVLPSDVSVQSASSVDGSRSFVSFYVVGCVTYLFSFDNEVGQTRFAYHLRGPASPFQNGVILNLANGKFLMGDFEVGVSVPKDQIHLWQEALASNDAR